MFEQSLLNINGKTRKARSMALALFGQIAVILGLLLVPIIWPSTMSLAAIAKSILVAPSAPSAPPPPPATPIPRSAPVPKYGGKVFTPREVPRTPPLIIIDELPDAAPPVIADYFPRVPGGIPCGRPGLSPCGTTPGGIPGLPPVDISPPSLPSPPPPKNKAEDHPAPPQRITVGGVVEEANLIHRVIPSYPTLARQARAEGTVVLSAVISKEGRIQQLTVVRGSPLLITAAMEAVRQWVYRPTTLNGLPVEVETQIEVRFVLSGQ